MLVAEGLDILPKSKPPATNRTTLNMPEPFVFVPITQNEAAKGRGLAKRIVRAHVTRVQHAKSSPFSGIDVQNWTVRPYVHKDSVNTRKKPKVGVVAEKRRQPLRPRNLRNSPEEDLSSAGSEESSVVVALPPIIDNAADDPFWTFPVDYEPVISPLFAHYVQHIAVDNPDLDGPDQKGLLRRQLFPLCMTEPATMYAVLLMGASHYCTVNPAQASLIDLLAIKSRALCEINAALTDPNKALSDATIMAVAKVAACEAIFGDSKVFAAHMRGLQMMLKMRGGLSTLGLNGLLERMIVWIDLNACHLTGLPAHLGIEEYPTVVHFDGPDPYHFAGMS